MTRVIVCLQKLEYPRSLQKRTVGQCTCPDGQNCACAKEGPSIEDVIEVIVSNGQEDIPEVPVGIDPSIARIRQEQVEEQTDGERSVVNTQHLIPKEKGTEEIGHRLMEAKRNLGNQVTPGNSNKGDKPGCLCPEKGNDECACQEETVDGQQNQKKSIIAVI
ncbi:uncharacterized protein LOC133202863 [Saccostrea echinata]|uniref:uncharacterized protein LOC133202863 n=1 Tax=Saccostrea echinata TaxID=191078 RepID=UPI002A7F4B76|nr:uncharacterized protein LOC133202863 [Saccostrea echinata]